MTDTENNSSTISYDQFALLDLRIANILSVEEIAGADKLYKLTLDVGELGERVIVSAIKPWFSAEELVGKQIVYLANLSPKVLRGIESQGMLIAASSENGPVLLHPSETLSPGSKIS